ERCLVADAAGRVLVHLGARDVGQVELDAGMDHGSGECSGFLAAHAADADGHEQGGNLVRFPPPLGGGCDKRGDLVAVQDMAVALLADDIDRTHAAAPQVRYRVLDHRMRRWRWQGKPDRPQRRLRRYPTTVAAPGFGPRRPGQALL